MMFPEQGFVIQVRREINWLLMKSVEARLKVTSQSWQRFNWEKNFLLAVVQYKECSKKVLLQKRPDH
jgi:hypothetical protein